jgi:hypothetical protein
MHGGALCPRLAVRYGRFLGVVHYGGEKGVAGEFRWHFFGAAVKAWRGTASGARVLKNGQGRRNFFSAAIIAGSVAHQPFILKLSNFGFLLKCSASQSPNSRSFDSVFSAQTALNPLSTVLFFPVEHFLQRCPRMAQPAHPLQGPGGWKPNTVGLLASRLLLSIKPGTIPGAGFYEY